MAKKQISIRASANTIGQIDYIAKEYNMNKTEVILLAVERLYRDQLQDKINAARIAEKTKTK